MYFAALERFFFFFKVLSYFFLHVFPTSNADKYVFPIYLFILRLQIFLFFNLLQCFDTFFSLIMLETLGEFRSLKYASVYVIVPFQSASELSFPSSIFSGVMHIRYFIIWYMETPGRSQGHLQHLQPYGAWKGMSVCAGQVQTLCSCASLDKETCASQKILSVDFVSRRMSVYLFPFVYNYFF